ncbi:Oidioi.mRNA.OKI2018_I69.PAR.g13174.t1.cds [Oikopleura dioica]|uniref:Oidioi.mRNA.OKI2018_I69.PAR.g13174.t1.cds n=1 Tax=Oikopleura dioica TaxID=34765 RepID=A0ABN7S806_OIKDI|nr:Oidioi.mRNA.OKI2018_I69.PAR.g13174.t1.cds [Oikopleura dioica]
MIDQSQIESTEEEARNLEILSGGNQFIVQFVDFLPMERPDWFKLTSISFLVMEFCELGSLSDWIGRRKQQGRWTSSEEVGLIGAQIISALAYCHSRDIAHLDVKPQNVFIKGDGITRTKLSQIRGENEEFIDFEILLQKCLNPQKPLRPENALQLRGEAIFCEFLERIESGEAPNEIIAPPEEIIRRLRETNAQQEDLIGGQKRRILELEAKLGRTDSEKRRIRELEGQNREILAENANLKQKVAAQEEDLKNILAENERKNQIEENLKIENRNQKKQIADLKRKLDQFKNQRQVALNEGQQREEFDLRRVAAPIVQPVQRVERRVDEERRNELEKSYQKFEVAENGWNLIFRGGNRLGENGWHHLWIWRKDGGVRFKAVVQEIAGLNGGVLSRGEITSEPDGQKQKITYKYSSGYKDGKHANIDVGQFETNQGVTTALDTATGETVIVKAILLQNAYHWKSTQQEAATLRELDHANVVRFVDFLDRQTPDWAEFGAMSFIIMEHCAGGSLVDWIEKMKQAGRRTTLDEARIIAAQMISGLSYCHRRNKVHLDLKPANIFVDRDFITVKIGDFGSAHSVRSVQDSLTTSSGDGIKCTPLYAAPEMHNKEEDAKKSPRLDVWGFALILQEVLTLEHPYGRVDGQPALTGEIMANIQTGKRTSLFEIFGETDEVEEFEVLLEKCTSVDRKSRPRNAIELRNEGVFVDFLEKIENGERASNIVPSPFPIENDEVEKLKEEMRQKDRTIRELQYRVANFDELKEESERKAAIINQLQDRLSTFNEIMEDRINEEALAAQNRKFLAEISKLKQKVAEQEEDFADLNRELDEFKNREQAASNERQQRGELDLRRVAAPIVQRLFQPNFEKLSAKFWCAQKFEAAKNGWNLKIRGGYGRDGWHHLWIGNKDGGVRFKAVVQEIYDRNGNELSRGEVTSEPDGQKQKIKFKWGGYYGFVRYNITLL